MRLLLDDGGVTATVDLTAAREHQVFELVVDWPRWSAAPTAT